MKNILYFSKQWPRRNASAGIIKSLVANGSFINFICPQNITSEDQIIDLKYFDKRLNYHQCKINDENSLKEIFSKIGNEHSHVIYDTYVAEEFFSHYVYDQDKSIISILDTQDLHFLRDTRKNFYLKNKQNNKLIYESEVDNIDSISNIRNNKLFLREMASILRSDIVFLSSDMEKEYLKTIFAINEKKMLVVPFFYDMPLFNNSRDSNLLNFFREKQNFVFIGNYQHLPNRDTIIFTVNNIFPKILKIFDEKYSDDYNYQRPELHIYGVNIDSTIKELENKNSFVRVKGFMPEISILDKYRVILAPIVYGAGIKGKITDSWFYNVPVITTSYGAEGLLSQEFNLNKENNFNYQSFFRNYKKFIDENKIKFGGIINDNYDDIPLCAFTLYNDYSTWEKAVLNGREILRNRMSYVNVNKHFINFLKKCNDTIRDDLDINFVIKDLLYEENCRTTKFMAKYIELKNKLK